MSPGSRPSPSLPSHGHSSPTTTSTRPTVTSHRLIIQGRRKSFTPSFGKGGTPRPLRKQRSDLLILWGGRKEAFGQPVHLLLGRRLRRRLGRNRPSSRFVLQ